MRKKERKNKAELLLTTISLPLFFSLCLILENFNEVGRWGKVGWRTPDGENVSSA